MEIWDVYDADRRPTGRTVERGQGLAPGEYHLAVHVWIQNSRGELLISKRSCDDTRPFPSMWECTRGSALAGEDSLAAALREVKEELGIALDPARGKILHSFFQGDFFADVWLFRQEVDLETVVFQEGETCDAKWATRTEIDAMLDSGAFVPIRAYSSRLLDFKRGVVSFSALMAEPPRFAVIAAKYKGKWVFVRHRERNTYELPGGHIEPGETEEQAARRELREESGAEQFKIWCLGGYCVDRGGEKSYGALFYAEIESFGAVPGDFEMAERVLLDEQPAPDKLTYPDIIPALVARIQEWRGSKP